MSTIKTKNVQVGTDSTASNNFTIYVPGTPDGTVRIGNGDAGAVTDAVTINSSGAVTLANNLSVSGTVSSTGDVAFDTDTLYVDSTNNLVGVGTNSPNDITGTGLRQLVVGNNSGNNGVIVNSSSSGDSAYSFAVNNVKLGRVGYDYLNNMTFQTNNAERMRIDSSGNLLIGTTSQLQSGTNHSIHIKSSNYPQITYQNTIAATGGSYWVSGQSSNDYWYLLPAPQNKGVYLTYTSTTGWSSFSDETLKENLVPIENALDKINTLRTVTGNYIDDPEHPHVFLIAQDVQAILPEAVHMNLDHNVLGMNYNEIIPLLTAGIKELKEENDTLKSQLSSLETRIQTLESA